MSSAFATKSLESDIEQFTNEQLRDVIIKLCRHDGRVRVMARDLVTAMKNSTRLPVWARDHDGEETLPERPSTEPVGKRAVSPSKSEATLLTRLPSRAVRVQVYRNGDTKDFHTIAAKNLDQLLREATEKLKLVIVAKRLFDKDGKEIVGAPAFNALTPDDKVWVSSGEPFRKAEDGAKPMVATIAADSRLVRAPQLRLFVRRANGGAEERMAMVAPPRDLLSEEERLAVFLSECTAKLDLVTAATRLYLENGQPVRSLDGIAAGTGLIVTTGSEPYRAPGAAPPSPPRVRAVNNHLIAAPAKSIFALKNGTPGKPALDQRDDAVMVVGNTMDKLLENATTRLQLTSAARRIFAANSEPIYEFDAIERGGLYYISQGEGFVNPADPTQLAAAHIARLADDSRLNTPTKLRLTVFRNGEANSDRDAVRVVATDMAVALEEATRKLKLSALARRMYTTEGKVITDLTKCTVDQHVVVTCGEPFKSDATAKPESLVAPIAKDSRLLSKGRVRVFVLRNGWTGLADGKSVLGRTREEILAAGTIALGLSPPARRIYTETGAVVKDVADLTKDQKVYLSQGEKFVSPEKAREARTPSPQREAPADFTASRKGASIKDKKPLSISLKGDGD